MSATDASGLLGPQGQQVLESIGDEGLKLRIFRALDVCYEALLAADALDLTDYETLNSENRDLTVWNEVAPSARQLLLAAGRAGSTLKELFQAEAVADSGPTSIDLDSALTLLEDGESPEPVDARGQEIKRIVGGTWDLPMALEGVSRLAGMLQDDIVAFGQRLRNPSVVTDHWLLLAELQELKNKCIECLEAVAVSLLQPFTYRPAQELLPRFEAAIARALVLREKLVELAEYVARIKDKLQRCRLDQVLSIRHAILIRINEFIEHEAYRYLRPADKRELSKVQGELSDHEHDVGGLDALRIFVEGLATFLDVLRSLNQRDRLVHHDRQKTQTALMLIDAEADDGEVVEVLRTVYGRDPALDPFIRALRGGQPIARSALRKRVRATARALQ